MACRDYHSASLRVSNGFTMSSPSSNSIPATVFDDHDHLAAERICYDRGTVLRQLGVFHEPQTILGQISILATHP